MTTHYSNLRYTALDSESGLKATFDSASQLKSWGPAATLIYIHKMNRELLLIKAFLLLMLSTQHVRADQLAFNGLDLNSAESTIDPTPFLYVAQYASENPLTIDAVNELKFERAEGFPNLGYTTNFVWYRLDLRNPDDSPVNWLLRSGVRYMRPAEIYLCPKPHVRPQVKPACDLILYSDQHQPFSERLVAHRHLMMPVNLDPGEQTRLYLRFRAGGIASFPFYFMTQERVTDIDTLAKVSMAGLIGVLAALVLVNFSHYLATRETAYLLYAFQESSIAIYLLHMEGFGFQYLWPNWPEFNAIASPFLGALSIGFAAWFGIVFLKTKETLPRTHNILLALTAVFFIVCLSSIWLETRVTNQLVLFLSMLTAPLIIWAAGILAYQGSRPAVYYMFGWLLRYTAGIPFVWVFGGLSDTPTPFAFEGLKLGIGLQAIIFSLGLAGQYRQLVREYNDTQQELLDTLDLRLKESQELVAVEREKQSALEQVLKNSRVLASASHDVVQPVRSLRLAFEQWPKSRENRESITRIEETIGALEEILESTLTHSSRELQTTSETVRVEIEDLLHNLASQYRADAREKGLFIRVHSPPLSVDCSATVLRRCLGNLLSNAIRYTEQGGVLLALRRRRNGLLFQVFDTGVGMSEGQQANYRTDFSKSEHSPGFGIGLGIVHALCRDQHWQCTIRSVTDRGTCVQIFMPFSSMLTQGAEDEL